MKCVYCEGDIAPPEKPYTSKQAAMEGVYHWHCFVEACRNRVPVGIGTVDIPGFSGGGDDDEPSMKGAAASVEE
jgi:hypothetical protein